MPVKEYYTDQLEEIIQRVQHLIDKKQKQDPSTTPPRILISLAGIPGSGKSTFSHHLTQELTRRQIAKTKVLPQDGFHLYRSQLSQLQNPEEAFRRRGAPYTFNAQGFVELIARLKESRGETILAPSFDHKLKDPVEGGVVVDADTAVVIIEGNYVLLRDEYWDEIGKYVDESWFIDTPMDVVEKRIVRRHLAAGIESSEQAAIERTRGNDLVNARYILENSKLPDVVIHTRE